jgi:hypothetical protein
VHEALVNSKVTALHKMYVDCGTVIANVFLEMCPSMELLRNLPPEKQDCWHRVSKENRHWGHAQRNAVLALSVIVDLQTWSIYV